MPLQRAHPVGDRHIHEQANEQDTRTCADGAGGASSSTNYAGGAGCTLADRISTLEVQKRRRRCDGEHDRLHTESTTPSGVGDDMMDDLCLLLDQFATKDANTHEKFMPSRYATPSTTVPRADTCQSIPSIWSASSNSG